MYRSSILCLLVGSYLLTSCAAKPTPKTCGYDSCTKSIDGMLNVHIVPHTHDDVGWLKTVDQYYYGSKNEIQEAGVQYILDSVVKELIHDPNKKFIYVETVYLWKWWMSQHDIMRHKVKSLVNNGQLEIIGGGWSMNDEAATNYQSIIDQMTWGFRKINETFGSCGRPHIGWQIDPFGHSREQASLFAQMGFDGLFLGRIDYQDKALRKSQKHMEMVWEASPNNLGKSSDLFTHVLYNGYSPPPGFCFDSLCQNDPIVDSKRSHEYNLPQKIQQFLAYVTMQSAAYGTNNIILTMGEDFNFQNANMWYKNLDLLIRHVNEGQNGTQKVNVFYSTPSCYLKAVHDSNQTWSTKQDDFFPYASDPHAYWTGYFTSKPTMKYFERLGNNFLQICKQLYSTANLGPEDWTDINRMREAMGIMQHHDAITGTEKDHVTKDYAKILNEAFDECGFIAHTAINKLIAPPPAAVEERIDPPTPLITYCLLLNISSCNLTESSNNFVVTVYNPLGHLVTHFVRVPVTGLSYSVQDPSGTKLKVQLVPIHESVVSIVGRKSRATNELVFEASDLPPLGFRAYFITKLNNINRDDSVASIEVQDNLTVGSEKFGLVFGPDGSTKAITTDYHSMPLQQSFSYYRGMHGKNKQSTDRASGAYIFRPNGTTAVNQDIKSTKVFKGPLVEEVHQVFGDGWISQVVRIYRNSNHAEFEWLVGPIPDSKKIGKEVITRFQTDLASNGTFYTDSNGREMIKRVRDFRPTWKLESKEKVAANYYPVTSKILLRDLPRELEVAVLTDRAQGGTSMNDGEIELMIHRRLFDDDGFGVDEALDEKQFDHGLIARGKHYLIGGPILKGGSPSLAAQERGLALNKLLNPWTFVSAPDDSTVDFSAWAAAHRMEYSGLKQELPENVHLLTLEPWKGRSLLLRLEHYLEKTDDPTYSKPATVNLQNLFTSFTIISAEETTLGGNQLLKDNNRFQWRKESNRMHFESTTESQPLDISAVVLTPMQIRTFIVEIDSVYHN